MASRMREDEGLAPQGPRAGSHASGGSPGPLSQQKVTAH